METDRHCLLCKKPVPPNAPRSWQTLTWWQCPSCTRWYHEICLQAGDGAQRALGDAWCPQCEQRSREDATGLGDFAQNTAACHNHTLKRGLHDVLHYVPVPKHPGPGKPETGMVEVMVHQLLSECDNECNSLALSRISLMGMLGASGKGKTVIANCLMQGSAEKLYLTDAPSLAPEKLIREQLKHLKASGYVVSDLGTSDNTVVTKWNPQEDHSILGKAAFGADGLLLEANRQQLLEADHEAKRGLVDALMSGQPQKSGKQQGSLLPVFQQGRRLEITSCQNVVVMKGSRIRVLMLPFTAKLLLKVVMACKKKAQEWDCPVEKEALEALFPGKNLMGLPETPQALQMRVDENLRSRIPMGFGIDVVLPNKSRQDDLLFVQQLLRRLCGANGAARESWTYLIWQVYVFIDDGPLPPSKGLMDVPGGDSSPLRAVIRSEGFKQVDSLMMVMDFKTFEAAENGSPLMMLQNGAGEQARLMERVVQGEVSLVVVMNERTWSSYEDMDEGIADLSTDFKEFAEKNREQLAGLLKTKVKQPKDKASMQALADNTPIIMYRPMMAAAILLAVADGRLTVDAALKRRLEATGQLELFKALSSNSRANVLPYIQRCMERMQHITTLGRFVRDAAVDSDDWDREAQVEVLSRLEPKLSEYHHGKSFCFKNRATDLLAHLHKHFKRTTAPDAETMLPDHACYSAIRGVWLTEGKHKVEQQLNSSSTFLCGGRQLQLPEMLDTVEQCRVFGQQLQDMMDGLENDSCLLLQPVLDWVDKLGLECLTPLIEPVASMQQDWLQYAVQQLQAGDIPEGSIAASVVQMHLQHVLPAIQYKPSMAADANFIRQNLLRLVRAELRELMRLQLTALLHELKNTVRQRERALGPAAGGVGGACGAGAPATHSGLVVTADRRQPQQLLVSLVECSLPGLAVPELARNASRADPLVLRVQGMLADQVYKHLEDAKLHRIWKAGQFVKCLTADMLLLSSREVASEFEEATTWLTSHTESIQEWLERHTEKAAQLATDLLLLQHQHRRLVARHSIGSIVLYDSTPRQQQWEEFKHLASLRDTAVVEMGSIDWRAQLPPGQQVEVGHIVNIRQICVEFAGGVVGLEGKVHDILANRGSAGHPLLLSGVGHQVQALQDLLTIHLLSITQRELQMGRDHQMLRLTGITACEALTSGALQHDPWVVLVVLSLLTGNVLHVLVQDEDGVMAAAAHRTGVAQAAAAPGAATGATEGAVTGATEGAAAVMLQQAGGGRGRGLCGQAAASGQGGSINTGASSTSTRGNRKRVKSSNVIVKIDAAKGSAAAPVRLVLPAGEAGRPTGRKASSSSAASSGLGCACWQPAADGRYQRVTSLRLLLQDGEWHVEVLSSRLVKPLLLKKEENTPGACVLAVGREAGQEPLDNYKECVLCNALAAPEVHCSSCHFSTHSRHVPPGQRSKPGCAWWCKVCTKRGLARGRTTRA